MAEKYDVAIIGAGIGGLCAGALLAKEGKKVVLLEGRKGLGGRSVSIPIHGINTELGFHGIVKNGHLVHVLEAVKQDIPMIPLDPNFVMYSAGKFYEVPGEIADFAKFEYIPENDREELMDILRIIHDTPFEEAEDYDLMGWGDWLKEHTSSRDIYDFIALLANIPMTEEYTSNISAGEALRCVGAGLREKGWSIYPRDGAMNVLTDALAKVITDAGGSVRTNVKVREVVVKNSVVQGVSAESGDALVKIETPVVISNLPVWDIFKITNQEDFPRWFVERVHFSEEHSQAAPSASLGLTCVSSKPLNNYKTAVLVSSKEPMNSTGPSYVRWLSQPTNWIHGMGEDKHLFQYGPVLPRSYVALCRERPSIYEKEINNLWNEIFAMHPHFTKEDILWKGDGIIPSTDCSGKFPGNAWRQRIDVQAPNVKGLYFVGDTVRGWGVAMDTAACSAILCTEKILKKSTGISLII